MLASKIPLSFGKPFKPMVSARTSFAKCLNDVSARHRGFVQSLDEDSPAFFSLSFRNPAFTAETKLDGERMMVHLSRDGIVKIHSRVGNWYRCVIESILTSAMARSLASC
jgi:hypothetical protein